MCFAQVPGYMGKKLIVTPIVHLMPAIRPALIKADILLSQTVFQDLNYKYKDPIPLNLRVGAEVEYVLGRSFSTGGGISYFNPGVLYDSLFLPIGGAQPEQKEVWVKIHSLIYSAHFTFYRGSMGYLAPVGSYNRFDLVYMDNKTTESEGPNTKNHFFTFGYTSGYQRIYKNKYVVDLGAQLLLNGRVFIRALAYGNAYDYNNRIYERLAYGTFMTFRVRVGYIL
jgi:hypothetical protein